MRTPGVVPGPLGSFIGGATAQIDEDLVLDQWTISSKDQALLPDSDHPAFIPKGEPSNEVDDVTRGDALPRGQ